MKRLLSLLLISFTLYSSSLKMDYIGEFSIFGQVASAKLSYNNNGKEYKITVTGSGYGIVKKLTNDTQYIAQSEGVVEDGILIPNKYFVSQINSYSTKIKTYNFDKENNKTIINRYKKTIEDEYSLDIISMSYNISEKVIEKNEKEVLDKLFKDDMVSMFFNKKHKLLSMKKGETKLLYAAGSKDTQKGIIVKLINKKNSKSTFSINVKKDYLDGGSRDAIFILDEEHILCETRIEGVLFFGDAKITRINYN